MDLFPQNESFSQISLLFPPTLRSAFLAGMFSTSNLLHPNTNLMILTCVRTYNISTAYLTLEHNYPRSKTGPAVVSVDINAVLESVTAEELRVGAWVNVIGYVRDTSHLAPSGKDVVTSVSKQSVYIDAVMVFQAGPVALAEYERILREAQNVDRRLRQLH